MFLNVKPSSKHKLIHEFGFFQLHAGVMWHRSMLIVAN